jgi:hypothetical protein
MEGLDPATHHLGESRVGRDLGEGNAGDRERGPGPAGGEEAVPVPDEGPREPFEAGLVPDREERRGHGASVWPSSVIG